MYFTKNANRYFVDSKGRMFRWAPEGLGFGGFWYQVYFKAS